MRPKPGTRLAEFAAIEEAAAKGLSFGEGRDRFELFVLRWKGRAYAYENECPHARTSLDWRPDAFFTLDRTALLCGTHGAQFAPDTGLCFHGPCKGKTLKPFPIVLDEAGWIVAA